MMYGLKPRTHHGLSAYTGSSGKATTGSFPLFPAHLLRYRIEVASLRRFFAGPVPGRGILENVLLKEQAGAWVISRPSAHSRKRAEDLFFTTMSVIMLAIVFMGFGSSYFLRGAAFSHLPSLLVHLHGAVFSSWIILFVVQSSLVTAGNVRLHRKLGIVGAVIAGLMVVLGVLTPFGTLRRGAQLPSIFTPTSFLIGNVLGVLFFGAFVAVAVWKRNNRIVHKRLMLIANAMLMPPALSRMAFPVMAHPRMSFPWMAHYPFLIGAIPLAMIVALFLFDLAIYRRPFAVTVIGGFLYWAADPVSDFIINTQISQHIALWAQHHP